MIYDFLSASIPSQVLGRRTATVSDGSRYIAFTPVALVHFLCNMQIALECCEASCFHFVVNYGI